MEKKNIVQGNEKIARFMGGRRKLGKWVGVMGATYKSENFKYDSSWDWLMPVIEKIGMLNNHSYRICNGHTTISNNTGWVTQKVSNNSIGATYDAVLDFIDWYSTHSPDLKKD